MNRRSMLKRSASAAALAAGLGAATAGTAGAKQGQGGSGLVREETWDAYADSEFQVVESLGTVELACRGNERPWQCYRIRFENEETALLHVNPDRRLDTTEDGYERWHEFTEHKLDCKECPRVKVSFKPVTPRN
jgi:hypothetical protein